MKTIGTDGKRHPLPQLADPGRKLPPPAVEDGAVDLACQGNRQLLEQVAFGAYP